MKERQQWNRGLADTFGKEEVVYIAKWYRAAKVEDWKGDNIFFNSRSYLGKGNRSSTLFWVQTMSVPWNQNEEWRVADADCRDLHGKE